MSTYRVRLLDYNEYSEDVTFGTCEICMHSGIATNPTFTFEFTDTETGEKTVRDVEGYMWDWGDYYTVYISNVALFGDWLENGTVTVLTKNMNYWDIEELANRFALRQKIDTEEKRMSYDVTVGTKDFNYTSNMRKFFMDFGVHPAADLDGCTPQDAAMRITNAFAAITDHGLDALHDVYDAPNGWGDVEGATRFLMDIYMACITETDVDAVEAY